MMNWVTLPDLFGEFWFVGLIGERAFRRGTESSAAALVARARRFLILDGFLRELTHNNSTSVTG
jgi:hypothetical protein